VGVTVDALLTGSVSYFLHVRDERRELRAVARVLDEELASAATLLEAAPATGVWKIYSDRPVRSVVRQEHKLLLARHLDTQGETLLAVDVVGGSVCRRPERLRRGRSPRRPR
jgi:hypothetical protein